MSGEPCAWEEEGNVVLPNAALLLLNVQAGGDVTDDVTLMAPLSLMASTCR